jgi:predicted CoA-binding protein
MAADGLSDEQIITILTTTRRIAMVGASANPARPSNAVMHFLLQHGFDVTPVNPGQAGNTIHDCPVVANLDEATPLDMVDVFRPSAAAGPIVADAIRLGAKTIWMQLGVVNQEAAALGRAAGLTVVMNRCPDIEWPRLGLHHAGR